jgi:hypothetical protein
MLVDIAEEAEEAEEASSAETEVFPAEEIIPDAPTAEVADIC